MGTKTRNIGSFLVKKKGPKPEATNTRCALFVFVCVNANGISARKKCAAKRAVLLSDRKRKRKCSV
jgi:hypothetical protein